MKRYKILMAAMVIAVCGMFTGCKEEPVMPPLNLPKSEWVNKVNMTILEFKNQFWTNDINYFTEVGQKDGEDIYLSGYVIANDSTGNIYNQIIIQDATAAMVITVDMDDLYKRFRIGQQVFVKATGLFAGKRSGLFELGKDDYYNMSGGDVVPQIGYLDEDTFNAHVELNGGWGDRTKVYTIETQISEVNSWNGNAEKMKQFQSQLLRINDVSFKGGGSTKWAVQGTSNNSGAIVNAAGQELATNTSGYCTFNQDLLPEGHGDVVAILGYYQGINSNKGNWQLLFRSTADCLGFGGESYAPSFPVEGDGTQANPYSIGAVLGGAQGTGAWIEGYIVGWIDGMSMADGAKFTVPATSTSNIMLANTPDEKNPSNCVPIQLSSVRDALNLQAHPENLGHKVKIQGNLTNYFSAKGLKECTAYEWVGDAPAGGTTGGGETGGETPTTQATYRLATSITSGNAYVMVANGKIAQPIAASKTYGYLQVADATVNGNELTTSADNEFVFEATTGGYTIKDSTGRYLQQTGTYNSFNVVNAVADGCEWTVTFETSGVKIFNTSVSKFIQFDPNYTSYGSYSDARGVMPTLYEKVTK